jgi:hypothetical protein
MNELEANDAAEADEARLSSEAIHEILQRLNDKKETLRNWLKQIEENDGKEISTVDLDAHIMHTGGDGRNLDACYNVQSVVDEKNKLIVDFDVSTCPDDKGALPLMTGSAKEIMGVDEISAVADKGYYDGGDIEQCEQNGTTCYIPKIKDTVHSPDRNYDKSNFKYDVENDCYICPERQTIPFNRLQKRTDGIVDRLYQNKKICKGCPKHDLCTSNKSGRIISRNANQNTLDIIDARMQTAEARLLFRERKKIVEHPFGTTKAVWGYRQFLCRGQEKTTAEISLTFLAYNFRRVFNIMRANGKNMVDMMA